MRYQWMSSSRESDDSRIAAWRRRPLHWLALVGLLAALLGIPVFADAAEFEIVPGAPGNLVIFESSAPMESFEGKTDRIGGSVTVNPADLGDSVHVRVEVELASLDTGIGKRNTHMCENHLETEKYPLAVFEGSRLVTPPAGGLKAGEWIRVRLAGTMDLHGVKRDIEVPVDLRLADDGARLDVKCEFDIKLPDYEIKRPKFLVLKLNETQHVVFAAAATAVR